MGPCISWARRVRLPRPAPRPRTTLAVTLCTAACLPGLTAGRQNALDPSLDGDGKMTHAVSEYDDAAAAVTVARNGDILVAGGSGHRWPSGGDFAVARYRPDGTPDRAFGAGGVVTIDFEAEPDSASGVIEQPDGAIVVVGQVGSGNSESEHMAAVRLLADGRRDPSFGRDGVAAITSDVVDGDRNCPWASDVALTDDGRIVIAGSAGCGGEAGYIRMLAVRLLPDGRLDPTFGGDGTWTSSAGCDASGVVVQPDGKLLIGGQTGDNEYCEGGTMLLLRLHPDGSFDQAFGDDGERTIRFPDVGQAGAAALALDPRNRAVLAGYAGRRIASPGCAGTDDWTGRSVTAAGSPPRSRGTPCTSSPPASPSGRPGRSRCRRPPTGGAIGHGSRCCACGPAAGRIGRSAATARRSSDSRRTPRAPPTSPWTKPAGPSSSARHSESARAGTSP
jgi:uncharacterized delta-60 repeat protein